MIVLILLMIGMIVFSVLLYAVDWIFTCTPYALMLCVAFVLWGMVDRIHELIPGHAGLSFLSVAFVAMVFTVVMTHIPPVKAPFITMCCSMFLFILYLIFRSHVRPDAVQYSVLLTIAYSIALFVNCAVNVVRCSQDDAEPIFGRNLIASIIAGLMNAVTAFWYIVVVRDIWESFWYGAYRGEEARSYIEVKSLVSLDGNFASEGGAVLYTIGVGAACLFVVVITIVLDRLLRDR